jgi:hypothetical protein
MVLSGLNTRFIENLPSHVVYRLAAFMHYVRIIIIYTPFMQSLIQCGLIILIAYTFRLYMHYLCSGNVGMLILDIRQYKSVKGIGLLMADLVYWAV